jgi:hypothetical protein
LVFLVRCYRCKRLLEKTFEKLLKNETNTLPKSLVSSVKKKVA